ncbi:RCC1 domain-containing protein [Embleya scabrispora]|uniref:RCC1 domain-containing protein n=1 Tax=Embleya scabrispora TaxID=159449 RepID=UPI00039CEB5F|nr:RCC1 domain-containing protein [Embleya scabrispora]MYS84035.1 hypothetical protein [Streptomyces sp. SID5474]
MPVDVDWLEGVSHIVAGAHHHDITSDPSVWGWGTNRYGQPPDGDENFTTTPRAPTPPHPWRSPASRTPGNSPQVPRMLQRPLEPKLRPGVAVVDRLPAPDGVLGAVALPQAHLERGAHEVGAFVGGDRPADDATGDGVHGQRDVDYRPTRRRA